MRILVATPYFAPVIGGSQNYIVGLYSALRATNPDVQVDIITYNTEHVANEEIVDGLHVYRVPAIELLHHQFALPNYWSLFRLLRKLRRQHSYEYVNAHTRFFDTAWWGPWAARYLNAKSILTDHCADHPEHQRRIVRLVARAVDWLFFTVMANRYHLVTVVSSETKAFWASRTTKPVSVIPGGVDVERFARPLNVPEQLTFLRDLSKNTKVVTFAGRLIPAKGVLEFVQAAQQVSQRKPNVVFVVAGSGELLAKVRQTILKNLHVVTRLNQLEIASLLQHTDIFVHPSQHAEGLPLVLLEAGAAGCAVIATRQGATSSLLSSARGILCKADPKEIANCVDRLLAEPRKATALGQSLRRYVTSNHSWQTIATNYLRLLQVDRSH